MGVDSLFFSSTEASHTYETAPIAGNVDDDDDDNGSQSLLMECLGESQV